MMKKLLILATFLCSTPTLFSKGSIEFYEDGDCFDRAIIVMDQALNAGKSDFEATWYGNMAYALCEGYDMTDITYF